jgi:hypothetical protein
MGVESNGEKLKDIDVWEDCYDKGWGKLIVPDAFCHPAKFSRNLIERIYNHADNKWLKKGDFVLDPFGGVALGALSAITRGIDWVGVELEEKFVNLGRQNIEFWNNLYQPASIERSKLGVAKIIHGDSRKLKFHVAKLIGTPNLIVSSPPYADSLSGSDKPQDHARHQELATKAGHGRIGCGQLRYQNAYGRTSGNLSVMGEGLFWSASREIIQGCYDLIDKGGHAIWVTKDYVSKGKLIPFSDRWIALCEFVGFKVVCRHYATLVTQGIQLTFDGTKIMSNKKSFFRRLHERKGSPKIDWEDVVCMVK